MYYCIGTEVFNSALFALKGQDSIAQGNALGMKIRALSSPEGAHYQRDEFALSGLETFTGLSPRALPWAIIMNPFGVKNTRKNFWHL